MVSPSGVRTTRADDSKPRMVIGPICSPTAGRGLHDHRPVVGSVHLGVRDGARVQVAGEVALPHLGACCRRRRIAVAGQVVPDVVDPVGEASRVRGRDVERVLGQRLAREDRGQAEDRDSGLARIRERGEPVARPERVERCLRAGPSPVDEVADDQVVRDLHERTGSIGRRHGGERPGVPHRLRRRTRAGERRGQHDRNRPEQHHETPRGTSTPLSPSSLDASGPGPVPHAFPLSPLRTMYQRTIFVNRSSRLRETRPAQSPRVVHPGGRTTTASRPRRRRGWRPLGQRL